MNKITLDPTALSALGSLDHFTELCDPSGRTLGYFTPAVDRSLYDEVEIPIDEEELRRREHEEGSYTTAEVLDHLEKLPRRENRNVLRSMDSFSLGRSNRVLDRRRPRRTAIHYRGDS